MLKHGLHILFLFCSLCSLGQKTEAFLNANWQFRQKGTQAWHSASVPGTVHTDLLACGLIPDPFYADNEKKLQWIEQEDWEYKTDFTCDNQTYSNKRIELVFEGLDTYAKVYLNDHLILDANNMFRSWTVSVKDYLKEGRNTLLVVFESAARRGKQEASKYSYTLPGDEKVFTRKAQYQYGWDFGPRFVTCGIWKNIKLRASNAALIKNVHCIQQGLTDSLAKLTFVCEVECDEEGSFGLSVSQTGDAKGNNNRPFTSVKNSMLKKGVNTVSVEYQVKNPERWWCNGLGKAYLYPFVVSLNRNNTLIDQSQLNVGLRQIELVQDKDSAGRTFYFKLNGVPVFMKGANYIPPDLFLPRVTKEDYKEIVLMARSRHMNMLRVWGGGVYADDEFYRQCDQQGILVWQDLMFACAMYPGDTAFFSNVNGEVKEQVQRLANHPCLALWCGNNESDEGWHNWGWQKQFNYAKADSSKIWSDYQKLFHELIPRAIMEHDPAAIYRPSSPEIGWGRKESMLQGDSHYWGIWWGNEPFENYTKKVGRFMSEYGFQSMPALKTFETICDPKDLNLNSAAVKNHQKHPAGYQTIQAYMERDYKIPGDFENYIYASQLLQLDGMKTAIEAHRQAKPYCMGTLFWQLNDCWPGITWSSIDHNKTPKAFYYALKDLYNTLLLSVKKEDKTCSVYLTSDSTKAISGELVLRVKNFSGKTVYIKTLHITVEANSSRPYFTLNETELKGIDVNTSYLEAEFISGERTIKTLFYFSKPKALALSKMDVAWSYNVGKNSLKIKSHNFVKNLYVSINDGAAILSDNFFDMEAGEEKDIRIISPVKSIRTLKLYSLNDINCK